MAESLPEIVRGPPKYDFLGEGNGELTYRDKSVNAHARWSSHDERVFLFVLAETGSVTKAAKAVGRYRSSAYWHRDVSPQFAERWQAAMNVAQGKLEAVAMQRATTGWLEDVYHQGVIVGQQRRFSDTLLIFLLKSLDPKKYAMFDTSSGTNVQVNIVNVMQEAFDNARKRAKEIDGHKEPGP